jgi:hypothetical protein
MNVKGNSLKLLSLLLVAQVGLAVGLNVESHRYNGSFTSNKPLLGLNRPAQVDKVTLEDGDGHKVLFQKRADRWVLADEAGFPVTRGRVESLVKRLAELRIGWPVASTSGAAQRFKVADDGFKERVTLSHGDKVLARLYVGTSPTYRKSNVRVDGEDDIYSAELQTVDMPARADVWEDKALLTLNADDITRIDLPGVTLDHNGEGVKVEKLGAGEKTAPVESKALLNRIASLRYTASAGRMNRADADKLPAAFEFSVKLKSGATRDYRFTQAAGAKDYLLDVSGQPWRFRVSANTLNSIKADGRSKLVTAAPPPAASPASDRAKSGAPDKASSRAQGPAHAG